MKLDLNKPKGLMSEERLIYLSDSRLYELSSSPWYDTPKKLLFPSRQYLESALIHQVRWCFFTLEIANVRWCSDPGHRRRYGKFLLIEDGVWSEDAVVSACSFISDIRAFAKILRSTCKWHRLSILCKKWSNWVRIVVKKFLQNHESLFRWVWHEIDYCQIINNQFVPWMNIDVTIPPILIMREFLHTSKRYEWSVVSLHDTENWEFQATTRTKKRMNPKSDVIGGRKMTSSRLSHSDL